MSLRTGSSDDKILCRVSLVSDQAGRPSAINAFRVGCNKVLQYYIRPNKKISVLGVAGLKILGRVSTHVSFLIIFFSGKKI